jgi:peptidoglycan/xylan/chitin deacetylase (PgdA/CDA1 family)
MKTERLAKAMYRYLVLSTILLASLACGNSETHSETVKKTDTTAQAAQPVAMATDATTSAAAPAAAGAFSGKQVPILCYHQIRDWTAKDSKSAQVYIVPVAAFKEQMKALHDSGYEAILPDQLMDYLKNGKPLPPKPIMLTFDDATESQITAGLPELDKAGYKAVFYIMTVVLGRPNYMTRDQVKGLYEKGHVIGCHTWDHHMVTKYKGDDWKTQVEKPRALLETITGQPVKYFAYPFGLWNKDAAKHIKDYGFTAAFQLAAKIDDEYPMYTIRRIIPDGHWSTARLMKEIRQDF